MWQKSTFKHAKYTTHISISFFVIICNSCCFLSLYTYIAWLVCCLPPAIYYCSFMYESKSSLHENVISSKVCNVNCTVHEIITKEAWVTKSRADFCFYLFINHILILSESRVFSNISVSPTLEYNLTLLLHKEKCTNLVKTLSAPLQIYNHLISQFSLFSLTLYGILLFLMFHIIYLLIKAFLHLHIRFFYIFYIGLTIFSFKISLMMPTMLQFLHIPWRPLA